MPRRAQGVPPAELGALARRLENHRRSQTGRRRLPNGLWAAAAKLAGRYGVNRVHRVLRLDYYDLKRRVEASEAVRPAVAKAAGPTRRPAFVELGLGPPLLSAGTLLELEDRSGRKLTVRLASEQGDELIPLVRAVWGGAS